MRSIRSQSCAAAEIFFAQLLGNHSARWLSSLQFLSFGIAGMWSKAVSITAFSVQRSRERPCRRGQSREPPPPSGPEAALKHGERARRSQRRESSVPPNWPACWGSNANAQSTGTSVGIWSPGHSKLDAGDECEPLRGRILWPSACAGGSWERSYRAGQKGKKRREDWGSRGRDDDGSCGDTSNPAWRRWNCEAVIRRVDRSMSLQKQCCRRYRSQVTFSRLHWRCLGYKNWSEWRLSGDVILQIPLIDWCCRSEKAGGARRVRGRSCGPRDGDVGFDGGEGTRWKDHIGWKRGLLWHTDWCLASKDIGWGLSRCWREKEKKRWEKHKHMFLFLFLFRLTISCFYQVINLQHQARLDRLGLPFGTFHCGWLGLILLLRLITLIILCHAYNFIINFRLLYLEWTLYWCPNLMCLISNFTQNKIHRNLRSRDLYCVTKKILNIWYLSVLSR